MKPLRASFVRAALLIVVTVGLFGCDYATKSAAKATLEGAAAVPIAPAVLHGALELRYTENDDIAFSALRYLGIPRSPEILVGIATFALLVIVGGWLVTRRRAAQAGAAATRSAAVDGSAPGAPTSPWAAVSAGQGARGAVDPSARPGADLAARAGLALVLSGALGNIVDRLVRGYVVDFIHVKGWPVFNVADIAVVAGAALIGLAQLYRSREEPLADG